MQIKRLLRVLFSLFQEYTCTPQHCWGSRKPNAHRDLHFNLSARPILSHNNQVLYTLQYTPRGLLRHQGPFLVRICQTSLLSHLCISALKLISTILLLTLAIEEIHFRQENWRKKSRLKTLQESFFSKPELFYKAKGIRCGWYNHTAPL